MVKIVQKGDFSRTMKYFIKVKNTIKYHDLKKYGEEGVTALTVTTPVDTGRTAASWYYKIVKRGDDVVALEFHNSNIQNGVPIAIVIQYGHATKSGSFVQGRDYINPAIQPLFDKIADEAWKEVTRV